MYFKKQIIRTEGFYGSVVTKSEKEKAWVHLLSVTTHQRLLGCVLLTWDRWPHVGPLTTLWCYSWIHNKFPKKLLSCPVVTCDVTAHRMYFPPPHLLQHMMICFRVPKKTKDGELLMRQKIKRLFLDTYNQTSFSSVESELGKKWKSVSSRVVVVFCS